MAIAAVALAAAAVAAAAVLREEPGLDLEAVPVPLVTGLPLVQLGAFLMVALLARVLAAALPARRAARLNVRQALQYE